MKLQEALECVNIGERIRHKSWYRNSYIEMFEGVIREDLIDYYFTRVDYFDGLGYETQTISRDTLVGYGLEDDWEIYTGKLKPDEFTKTLFETINNLHARSGHSGYDMFIQDRNEKNLLEELCDQLWLLSLDYDFYGDDI